MKKLIGIASVLALSTALVAAASEDQEKKETKAKDEQTIIAEQLPSYPLMKCPVSGEALGSMGDAVDFVIDGRLVRLCCKSCTKGVKENPEKVFEKIDEGVIAKQKASYPMKTCLISGKELGSMGDPIDFVYGTRYVAFCCKGCIKGFQKNPDEQLAKVDAALIEAQKKDYPIETCVVSNEPLEEPIDFLYGTTLVRFCCKMCVKEFKRDPETYVREVQAARDKKSAQKKES